MQKKLREIPQLEEGFGLDSLFMHPLQSPRIPSPLLPPDLMSDHFLKTLKMMMMVAKEEPLKESLRVWVTAEDVGGNNNVLVMTT